jgi:hypothetical protein
MKMDEINPRWVATGSKGSYVTAHIQYVSEL